MFVVYNVVGGVEFLWYKFWVVYENKKNKTHPKQKVPVHFQRSEQKLPMDH